MSYFIFVSILFDLSSPENSYLINFPSSSTRIENIHSTSLSLSYWKSCHDEKLLWNSNTPPPSTTTTTTASTIENNEL